jgi:hypothetical protein
MLPVAEFHIIEYATGQSDTGQAAGDRLLSVFGV